MILNADAMRRAAAGYQILFQEGWEAATPLYPKLVMAMPSKGSEEHYLFGGGAPDIKEAKGEREEQNSLNYEIIVRGKEWTSELSIPLLDWLNDKLGRYAADAREMGTRARNHPDQLAAELLIEGFADVSYDGVAYFSDSHELANGEVQSNLVEEALSADTFEEAYTKLRTMRNPRGNRIRAIAGGAKPMLVVGSALQSTAERIVKTQLESGGGTNPNFGKADIMVNEHLDDAPDLWFLAMAGGAKAPLIWQERMAPMLTASSLDEGYVRKMRKVSYDLYGVYAMGRGLHEYIVGGGSDA